MYLCDIIFTSVYIFNRYFRVRVSAIMKPKTIFSSSLLLVKLKFHFSQARVSMHEIYFQARNEGSRNKEEGHRFSAEGIASEKDAWAGKEQGTYEESLSVDERGWGRGRGGDSGTMMAGVTGGGKTGHDALQSCCPEEERQPGAGPSE